LKNNSTSRAVSIEVGGQTITFTRDKVRAIYFGSASNVASQPSPRDEALRALKGVQSAVEGGISYRDYTPRVTDAKIVVDRYLDGGKSDLDAAKAPIAAAMGYYTLASNAWSVKISVAANGGMSDVNNEIETAKLGLDLLIKDCPTAQAEIQSNRKSDSYAALSVSNRASSDGFSHYRGRPIFLFHVLVQDRNRHLAV
jgi:hypothetical protein